MIAERGVELDAGVGEQLVRLLELEAIVFRRRRSFVDVVAHHQHELVVEALPVRDHLRGDIVLLLRTTAAVANNREFDRAIRVRQRQRIARNILDA
jgi:hypothetical protein